MWGELQASAFEKIGNSLTGANIHWLVMRNYDGLPEVNRSKDLDIGIAHKNFQRAYNLISDVLKSLGFSRVFKLTYQYAICATFFYVSEKSVESIKVDLIDGFVWRGAQVVSFEEIYTRRQLYKDFFVPSKLDDGFMLLIKPLMTGGFIKEKYRDDINNSLENNPQRFIHLFEETFGKELSEKLTPYLLNKDYDKLISYKKKLCTTVWKKCFIRDPIRTGFNCLEHFRLEFCRCLKRKRPTMIAVLGPDGVGKTTFLEQFIHQLAELCVCDEKDLVLYHFRPNIIPNIKQLLGGKKYDASKEDFSNPHRGAKTNPLSSLARFMYYWFDYVSGYYLKTKYQCRHNGKVIFDRYSSDYLVDPERSRVFLPYRLRKIFVRLTPQADIAYVLSCDAEMIYKRKQELSLQEIEVILSRFYKIVKKNRHYHLLDASLTPNEIVVDALNIFIQENKVIR